MAKSTKSYEARMLEMEKKEQESLEKAKRYAAQKKELLKRKKAEESKKRTHRLCQIGGAVESVLGAPNFSQRQCRKKSIPIWRKCNGGGDEFFIPFIAFS